MKKPEKTTNLALALPDYRIRFVTAASLFDGHDAAINIMRRILQSAGAEVIHLGHNRSARDIVTAALQEDAQAIAISSYQGGHVEYFRYIVDLLKEAGAPHIRVFGGGGGTITDEEAADLQSYGVTRIYSPADGRHMSLTGMIDDMVEKANFHPFEYLNWDKLTDFASSDRALAQALTCIEMDGSDKATQKAIDALNKRIESTKQKGTVIGITGTGGAGKSSLTDELILRFLAHDPNKRIAVVAIDPTRRKTGGALLGDRLRMNSLSNPRAFMRSLATREANVSISRATEQAVKLLRAAGFDWIIVETGGIGQADTAIVELADITMYVMTSEFGAPTQLEKINMLDYADVVVLNKFDKGDAQDAMVDVRKQFRRNHLEFEKLPTARYPVFGTIASRFADPGVDALFDHLITIQHAEQKRCAVKQDIEIEEATNTTIVPKNRSQYLSQISDTVRDYKTQAQYAVTIVRQWEGIDTTLDLPLSSSTKEELTKQRDTVYEQIPLDVRTKLEKWPALKASYEGSTFTYKVRDKDISVPLTFESLSHQNIPRIAVPQYESKAELTKFLLLEHLPGYFPYTAGVFPFKRAGEAPKRMFAGEGGPGRTNKRFHLLCEGEPAKRLSTAFDSVTLYGQDPDKRPDIYGKIGESGVSVCTVEDAKLLYSGFDLCDASTSVSMTINGPAPMLLSFFFNTAIDQQVEKHKKETGSAPTVEEYHKIKAYTLSQVRGTVQADILKEDQAQNTCIFSIPFALRMMGDIQQYFIENNVRNYYSVSISGYHIAEAGANPISQLAFTLANGFTYVEYYLARGMDIDSFAPNLSYFFSNGLDPEYTVIGRVARRIWAIAMQRLYNGNSRSQKLKYHIQTSGRSLHAQEISFNDIRTTLQALLAHFDHCNSLHTNAYDEAITTPTEESVRRAMAIQMIINQEFGWAKNENPLQGSFIVEALTDLVEEAVLKEFDRLSARGGVLGAMENQYQRTKIQEESLYYEQRKHSGELPIIGVNTYLNPTGAVEAKLDADQLTRASYAEKDDQIKRLNAFKDKNKAAAAKALEDLQTATRKGQNTFAALMEAGRVCSLGQISEALYQIGGEYRRSM